MATLILYPSAIEYWLRDEGIHVPFVYERERDCVTDRQFHKFTFDRDEILQTAELLRFSEPLHVGVPEYFKRIPCQEVSFHLFPPRLPPRSYVEISDGICLSTPEYCFLQAARYLTISELVVLANDLCGIYVYDKYAEFGQRRREPITNVASILKFLDRAGNINGVKKARQAIRYALDYSNSPMESKLAALMRLPLNQGGYAILEQKLNEYVKMSKDGAEYLGQESCCCDMVWREKGVVLEYDSTLSHLSPEQHKKDKRRITALGVSGYTVISVTSSQIESFREVETLMQTVQRTVNGRTRPERIDQFLEKRRKVVEQILYGGKKSMYEYMKCKQKEAI